MPILQTGKNLSGKINNLTPRLGGAFQNMFKPEVYINGQRLDLFEDEGISVVSSVQNISDISRVFNDYSQSFTVPASQNNNAIFKHYYNASINNGFDARVRHPAHIDIQGTPFRDGTIRLEKVVVEDNKPVHYKITFFGLLIDLKTVIGDDYLSSLDLSAYDLDYSSDNIITGLQTGFSSEDYIFPLISTDKQWFYNSDISDTTNQEKLANIAWNGGAGNVGMDWTSFRPGLLVMRIIEAIETKYSISFSRDFLGTAPFDNLYLWLANSDSEEALKRYTKITDYDLILRQQPAIGTFNEANGSIDIIPGQEFRIQRQGLIAESTDGVAYGIQLMDGEEVVAEEFGTGNLTILAEQDGEQEGASFYGRVVTTAEKTINRFGISVDEFSEDKVAEGNVTVPFTISGSEIMSSAFMPTIKTMDFLKSLLKMYNLTVVPTSPTDFFIETLDLWYAAGNTYDISKFVDTSKVTINRSKIYREIKFGFTKPNTILAEQFKKMNKVGYGDLETKLKNADGTPLDGGEFEIEVDFEQMVYERLIDLDDDFTTNIVYGLSLDKSLSEEVPEAHLFYGRQEDVGSQTLSLVQDDGIKVEISGNVFMPSHVNSGAKNYSTVFGGDIDEHSGSAVQRSLFHLYYQDYIADSFNSKRRKYEILARLPVWLLGQLKLNDRLVINADRYIINQMTVNATNQAVQFELLNDIYNLPTDVTVAPEMPENPTGETPPPLEGESFSITSPGSGADTRAGGCALAANSTKYANTVPPNLGTFIYNEIGLTTSFDGQDKYYKISGNTVIRINAMGIVIDVHAC